MSFLIACGLEVSVGNYKLAHGFFCFELHIPKESSLSGLLCGTVWPEHRL